MLKVPALNPIQSPATRVLDAVRVTTPDEYADAVTVKLIAADDVLERLRESPITA